MRVRPPAGEENGTLETKVSALPVISKIFELLTAFLYSPKMAATLEREANCVSECSATREPETNFQNFRTAWRDPFFPELAATLQREAKNENLS